MEKLVLGADLSYKAPGVVSVCSGGFFYYKGTAPYPSLKHYHNSITAAARVVRDLEILRRNTRDENWSVFESPPPRGVMAPALSTIDGMFAQNFLNSPEWSVLCCSPQLVKSVLGSRKATKKQSIEFAIKLVRESKALGALPFFEAVEGQWKQSSGSKFVEDLLQHDGIAEALIIATAFITQFRVMFIGDFFADIRASFNGLLGREKTFNFKEIEGV